MIPKNNTKHKLISTALILLILVPMFAFFSNPKKADALPVEIVEDVSKPSWITSIKSALTASNTTTSSITDVKQWQKKLLEELLRSAAKRLLAKMTESTINWINSGFHGSPLFVENAGSFFKDIAKSEIRNLVNTIGYDPYGHPFGKSAALGIINSYKSTFEQNAQYSLSKVTNDPALLYNFRNDFRVGGWDGFLLQTQFPQNNYIGYNLLVADEQARRLAGTSQNQAQQIRDMLQQGQGFLSPQICPADVNPNYQHNQNPWNRPSFKYTPKPGEKTLDELLGSCSRMVGSDYNACVSLNTTLYGIQEDEARAEWDKQHNCLRPDGSSGFVNTTPGSVVGSQVMKALGASTFDSTVLAGAMGNSLSAIFDALLNKLMSSGLNALSNRISGTGNTSGNDDFNYYGNTLGVAPTTGATSNTGFNWGGPDEVISLGTFKRDIQNAIDNGNKELKFIQNNDAGNPGILETFEKIWPKTAELDMCLPGPNILWEERVDENASGASTASFKDWVRTKMNLELPSARTFLNAVNSIGTINEQAREFTAREGILREMLVRLESIKAELGTMATEPSPGSAGEDTLVGLKQRYNGMIIDVPTTTTASDAQNKLADAKDKLTSLDMLITKCAGERTTKGWANPGGENSTSSAGTERAVFCDAYPGLPPASCDVVFETNISDYKR